MMTYQETLEYLYSSTPVFERSGASAYKPGLDRSIALAEYLDNPHTCYKTIHVAGTNGKGSVSNLLAAILQKSGYTVGLFTSPHLVDFRERIRVNGDMIPEEYVVDFVEKHKVFFEPVQPSFFELTSTLAFDYFRYKQVDYAVIEVGLGGRLDSTNIITPVLSVITNVSKDHTQYLGETLGEIAYEKAGIIKEGIPVVIGEQDENRIVTDVIEKRAKALRAPVHAPWKDKVLNSESHLSEKGEWYFDSTDYGQLFGELNGLSQIKNAQTVLCALRVLAGMGIRIPRPAVREGFEHVVEITGLQGRWQEVILAPYTVLDIGHNEEAWEYLSYHLETESAGRPNLYMVIGLSSDKNIDAILRKMPPKAIYLFTQASTERALPADTLARKAEAVGLHGKVYNTVLDAIHEVMIIAGNDDMIFIGGSNFIVAEALPLFDFEEF